jgi:hypothetical protein
MRARIIGRREVVRMGWEWLAIAVAAVFLAAVLVGVARRARDLQPRPKREGWEDPEVGGVIVLDLDVPDPDDPTVQRLVHDAGRRALVTDPSLEVVEVRDRDGRVLATVPRTAPLGAEPTIPTTLHEPHRPRRHAPDPVAPGGATREARRLEVDEDVEVPSRPFADRFTVTPEIRAAVRDPERPIDLVAAILEAAGRPVERQGDVVVSGDTAIAVVPHLSHGMEDALTRAFMHLRDTATTRGIVIRLGWVSPEEIRRREAAAPDVRHVTADAIQRMADAVALGGDPIAFAIGPAVRR